MAGMAIIATPTMAVSGMKSIEIKRRIGGWIARLMGFREFHLRWNDGQLAWAKTQDDADALNCGDSLGNHLPKWLRDFMGYW